MRKRHELSHPSSCLSKATDDEMLFVLLARDAASPATIRFWIQERIRLGKNKATDAQIMEAEQCAVTMESERQAKAIVASSAIADENESNVGMSDVLRLQGKTPDAVEKIEKYGPWWKVVGGGKCWLIQALSRKEQGLTHSEHKLEIYQMRLAKVADPNYSILTVHKFPKVFDYRDYR